MSPEKFEMFKSELEKIRFPNFFGFTFTKSQIEEVENLSNYIKQQLVNTSDAMRCRLEEVQT